MAKYSLIMTRHPCRVAGYIISITRTYSCAGALTYLLTYTLGSGRIKPAISPKRLTVEGGAKVTINGLKSYTCFRLPPKCMTLNDLCARFKVIDSLNAAKMARYSFVMTPTPCRVAGCIISVRRTYSCARALTYLLTQLARGV